MRRRNGLRSFFSSVLAIAVGIALLAGRSSGGADKGGGGGGGISGGGA